MNIIPIGLEKHLEDIIFCVANFNTDPTSGYTAFTPGQLGLSGDESNTLYIKGDKIPNHYSLSFGPKAKNCMVFLESGIQGKGSKISLKDEGSVLYIGKDTNLNNVSISLPCKGDFVIVGEGVSVTSTSNWSTGLNSGMKNNGLIVGDHCLMASEIAIRPADGHPIIDIRTRTQLNKSVAPIIIEPYCWIGQRAAILKNVRIGACSVISFGAVVTKSCTRFSVLAGVPAKARSIEGKLWLRNRGAKAMQIQAHYESRFAKTDPAVSS